MERRRRVNERQRGNEEETEGLVPEEIAARRGGRPVPSCFFEVGSVFLWAARGLIIAAEQSAVTVPDKAPCCEMGRCEHESDFRLPGVTRRRLPQLVPPVGGGGRERIRDRLCQSPRKMDPGYMSRKIKCETDKLNT